MLASDIILSVGNSLQDAQFVRWTIDELLGYLNQGQVEVALYKPNASVTSIAYQLTQGSKQTLPSGGLSLIDVVRNMGTDGATPGAAIRVVSRGVLDAQIPGWHLSSAANTVVKHYTYTPLDPLHYYVYPPQPGSGRQFVELVYSSQPGDVAANGGLMPTGTINIPDIYGPALYNYVMFRAYSKDAEYAADANLAQVYYGAFQQQLLGKVTAEKVTMPTKGAA